MRKHGRREGEAPTEGGDFSPPSGGLIKERSDWPNRPLIRFKKGTTLSSS